MHFIRTDEDNNIIITNPVLQEFKSSVTSDYVVTQGWVERGVNRPDAERIAFNVERKSSNEENSTSVRCEYAGDVTVSPFQYDIDSKSKSNTYTYT